jgi:hypothetical protein
MIINIIWQMNLISKEWVILKKPIIYKTNIEAWFVNIKSSYQMVNLILLPSVNKYKNALTFV